MIEGWCLPEQISVQRPEAMGLDLRGCHPKAVTYQSRITAMLRSGCPWEADLAGERNRSTLRLLADVFAKEHPDQVLKYLSADRADEARAVQGETTLLFTR